MKDDGGLAFPRPFSEDPRYILPAQEGMSLRDWFAGQALANMAGVVEYEHIAKVAYKIADVMLHERALIDLEKPHAD